MSKKHICAAIFAIDAPAVMRKAQTYSGSFLCHEFPLIYEYRSDSRLHNLGVHLAFKFVL